MELTGAQIFLECLKKEGVDVVFGFPGGAVIDIYDELPNYPFKHILVRHEQGAIHAADGYARATGDVGVCLVTSGPGATNTVTGIATAYMDSIPVVIFTGQVPTPLIGNDAFQEVDIVGITRPCTKHNYLVKDIKDLAYTVRQAFYLARTGRPGPVLVDLPKDIMQQKFEFEWPEDVSLRSYNPNLKPHARQIKKVAKLIEGAERPLIYAGGGVISSGAEDELTWLAQSLNIPVTATLMGLGAFPGEDPLWLGMLGMHGTYAANMAINNADLVLAIGARFDDRVTGKVSTFAPKATLVHIDIDPTSIQKNVAVHVPLVADCKSALSALKSEMEPNLDSVDWEVAHAVWVRQVQEWSETHPLRYKKGDTEFIKPQRVVEKVYEISKGEAIVATEVGQNQMWAAQFYKFKRSKSFLSSGGLGTMGFGFPAAIGAQMAFPDKLVVNIAGDGSIQMNIQEMMTAVCNNLPVKIVILNNGYLGMVRQWQELFYNRNYCETCMDAQPDFVKLAEAYGAAGYRVTEEKDLEPVLKEAFSNGKPTIIDVRVDPEENVYPMVPAGASLTDMLLV
ncbi:biosynthetic-type acetolactate synthase large subunit [Maridesulfovibrio salexigens]|uniref:Acetolactate synthase n=1 Tax=Maridesulfovibrio salexigens (strain ATCC 14822 / DSM 2638 / NCIMB 8403 / VKM B-1763) TaxID=526222 RepID=C6BXE8_MARSD|nr:biosynthetic-type acetolactate synthase large subunit [Maridesulfovibrio salexigens]ACS80454.1 acetolactate synthase, large subunit, biosynthetic type [Maridesulfovibrio salexigens DSM 2638]